MRKFVFIGCGSFIGAVARHLAEGIELAHYHEKVPLNTLFINVGGSFLMAFLLTIAFEVWAFDADVRLGLTTGLLGAFTTFSTFCKETSSLLFRGDYFSAIAYVTVSVTLGLGAAYFGIVAARGIGSRLRARNGGWADGVDGEGDAE